MTKLLTLVGVGILYIILPSLAYADTCYTSAVTLAGSAGDLNIAIGATLVGDWEHAAPFTPSVSCTSIVVHFKMKQTAALGDNVNVQLYDDSSGLPGASLETVVFNTGTLTTSYTDQTVTFTTPITGGTPYWITFERTGGTGSPYASVEGDTSPGGFVRSYLGLGWTAGNTPWLEIDGTSSGGGGGGTGTSTAQIVDNPVQDIYYGFMIFLGTLWGILWFLSRFN